MRKIADINLSIMQKLYSKVEQLRQLHEKVNIFLPAELHSHCLVANFENGVLKFAIESPAWATRLRYCIPDLLTTLRKESDLYQLASIEYYVEPNFTQIAERLFLSR